MPIKLTPKILLKVFLLRAVLPIAAAFLVMTGLDAIGYKNDLVTGLLVITILGGLYGLFTALVYTYQYLFKNK